MKIAIIHLSDIHIRYSTDPILSRAVHIASAVKSMAPNPDVYLLAVTGDIAFSGGIEQYGLARKFLEEIKSRISSAGKPVFHFFVPGNHDLDFSSEPDTRPPLVQSIRERIDEIDPKGETVRQILTVQQSFFEFEALMLGSELRASSDCLVYSHLFSVDDKNIRVNCFNTAWISTNPEFPAKLVFPTSIINADPVHSELVISAFHHPYNWLAPENAKLFRHHIEATSDVVMTGHEHESSVFVKQDSSGTTTHYIEGAVLQENINGGSGFNVILTDPMGGKYEAFLCQWTGDLYDQSSSGVHQFVRNKRVCKSAFQNNREFIKFLSDPGLPILHPRKREITLDDLYIYPALARRNPEKKFEVSSIVESQNLVEYVRSTPKILIVGEDTSGKTSLAKKLYRDFRTDGDLVPVFLSGGDFDGYRENDVRRIIRNAVISQYDEASADRFFRLDQGQRILIIDNWHHVKYAAKGRVAIMEQLKVFCGKLLLLSNRLYAFDELAETGLVRKVFADFEFCDIKEFGKRLTGKLIEKWHALGSDFSDDPREFNYAVASSEHKISALIGKGILPTFPIFLVGLLQADASPTPTVQSAGSYGHILESLITARLADVSSRSTDVGLLYTYASRIAYSIFKKEREFLSSKEISELHQQYCDIYQMRVSEIRIIADLIKAKILCKNADCYRFTYKGCYCYFVARYFTENLSSHESALRSELNAMTDRLAWEDFTNIVMFFLYLTRDSQIIDRLLENAGKIYEELAPSDLESDVQFVNKMLKEKPRKLLLPSTDVEANRDQYRSQQDQAENELVQKSESNPNQRLPYAPDLSEITKITIALQSIRVMGQVLRNFPGVLTAEPKFRLAEASYLLGLRTLKRLLVLAEQHLEELRLAFAQIFKEQHPLATSEEIENSADQKLIWLTGAASYGMIKKVCSSIGLQDLELTFQQVRSSLGDKTSVRLVDLAIHLEYFRDAPEAEIFDLEKEVSRNPFAYKILRDLVSEFLYLHNTDTQVFQRLGRLFEIEAKNPRFLLNKAVGRSQK
jgi:hypothetical protein